VDSVAAAQRLKGCTIIKGTLEIQIRGGANVGAELEENLGMIEEVTNSIKIVRSFSLVSLRFLRNLRIIHGQQVSGGHYGLFLLDNPNLQELWDPPSNNLTIVRGGVAFHWNRRLCLDKIYKLIEHIHFINNTNKMDERHISSTTNGDLIACNVSHVNLIVSTIRSTFAVIKWETPDIKDAREYFSWSISYRATTDENISIYNERSACGTDDWQTRDARIDPDGNTTSWMELLVPLMPYTKYAVYVQTYTIFSSKRGAMSPIVYFTTLPDNPSPVTNIVAVPNAPNMLHVSWSPPSFPNGIVTHYYLLWRAQNLDAKEFDTRDYCNNKLQPQAKPKSPTIVDERPKNESNSNCCSCQKPSDVGPANVLDRMNQIQFQNALHDKIYRKASEMSGRAGESSRKRRSNSNDWIGDSLAANNLMLLTVDDVRERYSSLANTASSSSGRLRRSADHTNVTDQRIRAFVLNSTSKGYLKLLPQNGTVADDENETTYVEKTTIEPPQTAIVQGRTEIMLENLHHFQMYSIEIMACQEVTQLEKDVRRLCSSRSIISARSLADKNADTIDSSNITVINGTLTGPTGFQKHIVWYDPPWPNGLIISYDIEMRRNSHEGQSTGNIMECISRTRYLADNGHKLSNLNPGNWSFRIRAVSLAGNGLWTNFNHFVIPDKDSGNLTILIITLSVLFVVILFVVLCVVYFLYKRRLDALMKENRLYVLSANPQYHMTDQVYVADEWEVPREKVKIRQELGQGSFGMVYEGSLTDENDQTLKVAIKAVHEKKSIVERINFLNEASVMKAFNCPHVVKLLGVVSKGQPTLVIMELMALGDLKNYLRVHRPDEPDHCKDPPPTLSEILQMVGEIADGMAYLAEKKFVHRDLAARNCMVAKDKVVKIGDFGMARDIYDTDYYRKDTRGLLPVRWMAPESLKDGIFTSMSDVWSFGVVLWEMATLAAQPYQGLSNEQVLKYIIDDGIMEKPEGCPARLYEMMLQCWKYNPKQRPTFEDILLYVSSDCSAEFHKRSFYFNRPEPGNDGTAEGHVCSVEEDTEIATNPRTPLNPHLSSRTLAAPSSSSSSSPSRRRDVELTNIRDNGSAMPNHNKPVESSTVETCLNAATNHLPVSDMHSPYLGSNISNDYDCSNRSDKLSVADDRGTVDYAGVEHCGGEKPGVIPNFHRPSTPSGVNSFSTTVPVTNYDIPAANGKLRNGITIPKNGLVNGGRFNHIPHSLAQC